MATTKPTEPRTYPQEIGIIVQWIASLSDRGVTSMADHAAECIAKADSDPAPTLRLVPQEGGA